tara:strand:+ start:1300 stop:3480 length:2181 start_codon:yes stop_codon:yes gene_type:complete
MTEEELDALISEVQKEKQIQGKDTELPTFDENQDLMLESAKENNTNIGLIQDITQKTKKVAGELEELVVPKLQDEDFVKSVTDETVRQLGLTARSMAEGGASLVGILYDPIAAMINLASQMTNNPQNIKPLGMQMTNLLNNLGIPNPEDATERIVNMVGQGMTGAGGSAQISRQLANFLRGTAKKVATIMSAKPGLQTVAGGGAGASGQGAAELGYGPVTQFISALLGGLSTGIILSPKGSTANIDDLVETIPTTTKETIQQAKNLGVDVMTTDAIPPSTFAAKWLQQTSEFIPILGTGRLRKAQQDQRISAISDLVRTYGVKFGNDKDILTDVSKSLLAKRGSDLTKYTKMKKSVTENPDLNQAGKVDVSNTIKQIDEEIFKLQSLRSAQTKEAIDVLKDWKKSLVNQNLANVEALRKFIGQAFEAPNLANIRTIGEQALNRIYAPLKEDMRQFIINFGKKNDIKKFDVSFNKLKDLSGELENNALSGVLKKGDQTPEIVERLLFSKKPSELKLLYKNLDSVGKANARSAIVARMFRQSLNNDMGISPEKFKAQIKNMSDNLGIFFNEKDLDSVLGLGKVLSITQRASQANIYPPTGQVLQIPVLSMFLQNTLGMSPFSLQGAGASAIALGTIGGIGRVIESPIIRNLLMKLGKTSDGSPEEAKILKRIDDIIILKVGEPKEETDANQALDNIIEEQSSLEQSSSAQDIMNTISAPTINKIRQFA